MHDYKFESKQALEERGHQWLPLRVDEYEDHNFEGRSILIGAQWGAWYAEM